MARAEFAEILAGAGSALDALAGNVGHDAETAVRGAARDSESLLAIV
jgi:hypothetical protein